jgi:hypothetical protein
MLAAGVFLTMIKYIAVAKSLPITAVYPHRLNERSVIAASNAPVKGSSTCYANQIRGNITILLTTTYFSFDSSISPMIMVPTAP